MANPLTRRLELFVRLDERERDVLEQVQLPDEAVAPGADIVSEGDRADGVHVVQDGFACRYRILRGGHRQILGFLVPGDICGTQAAPERVMDHGIAALGRCTVAVIPRRHLRELSERPAIVLGFKWLAIVEEATLREWLVNLGRRDAPERIAHLLCEIHLRLTSIGVDARHASAFPVTQIDLADSMGITSVHANRALRALRTKELIAVHRAQIVSLAPGGLRELSGFDPRYLHLPRRSHARPAPRGRNDEAT